MTAENGKSEGMKDALERIRQKLDAVNAKLLNDLCETLPRVRGFLLGTIDGGQKWPPGLLRIQRTPNAIQIVVSLPEWRYEARYTGEDLHAILEQLENDIDSESVPWEPDWRARQAQQRKTDRALGLS